jgi:hypothetical protein
MKIVFLDVTRVCESDPWTPRLMGDSLWDLNFLIDRADVCCQSLGTCTVGNCFYSYNQLLSRKYRRFCSDYNPEEGSDNFLRNVCNNLLSAVCPDSFLAEGTDFFLPNLKLNSISPFYILISFRVINEYIHTYISTSNDLWSSSNIILLGWSINKVELDGVCSTHEVYEKFI